MCVLIISEHFLPTIGGTGVYSYYLCKYLSELGWEVYLITRPSKDDPKAEWYNLDGINVFRLDIPQSLTKEILLPWIFPIYLLKQIRQIILKIHPDITHFTSGLYPMIITRLYYKLHQIPIILTIHNLPPAEASSFINTSKNKKINMIFKKLYSSFTKVFIMLQLKLYKFDHIISVSEATTEKILKQGILANEISIIPNGVDTEYFTNGRKKPIIEEYSNNFIVLTVGGIIAHKEQLNIVKSIPDIIDKIPNVQFLFVGPIRSKFYFNILKKTISELGLERKVIITGAVSQKDLLHYYQLCDIYLQPSSEEGFCISILEALSCGKPVIGTPTGEIPKLIHESRAGILIPNSSPEEISKAVIQLLTNNDKGTQIQELARNYAQNNYSWDFVSIETSNLYKEKIRKFKGI